MSFISPSDATSPLGLGSTSLSSINQADLPASVRNGNAAAKNAYSEALAFEQVLVNELAQQLTATVSDTGNGSNGSDGSDGSGDGAGDGTSGQLGSSLYSSLIPQALSSSIMSGGGVGIASEIAGSLDPALEGKL
jgi:Rod binding domain-containing protein